MRTVGTVSRGVRCPVIRQGDDLIQIVTDAILACRDEQQLTLQDRDIVAVTEAVVARAQGNYATIDAIAQDCRNKFDGDTIGLTFPILSRNRIAICLKGVARAFKKAYIQFSWMRRGSTPGVTCWMRSVTGSCSAMKSTLSPAWTMWNTTKHCSRSRAAR